MTVSLKHAFHSSKGDGTDPTKVQPSNWNAEHELTMATGKILGRTSPNGGVVEELDASALGLAIVAAASKAVLASLGIATTGDVKPSFKTAADDGWIMLNDGTIGNGSSGATNRANEDVKDLYVLMWDAVGNTWAPVTGGRGASGLADFNAAKPMALPRALGRALVVAGAGTGLTNRVLGSNFGEETHKLTIPELPKVTPTATSVFTGTSPNFMQFTGTTAFNVGADFSIRFSTSNAVPSGTVATTIAQFGGDEAHNNTQASTAINVMVKL